MGDKWDNICLFNKQYPSSEFTSCAFEISRMNASLFCFPTLGLVALRLRIADKLFYCVFTIVLYILHILSCRLRRAKFQRSEMFRKGLKSTKWGNFGPVNVWVLTYCASQSSTNKAWWTKAPNSTVSVVVGLIASPGLSVELFVSVIAAIMDIKE